MDGILFRIGRNRLIALVTGPHKSVACNIKRKKHIPYRNEILFWQETLVLQSDQYLLADLAYDGRSK